MEFSGGPRLEHRTMERPVLIKGKTSQLSSQEIVAGFSQQREAAHLLKVCVDAGIERNGSFEYMFQCILKGHIYVRLSGPELVLTHISCISSATTITWSLFCLFGHKHISYLIGIYLLLSEEGRTWLTCLGFGYQPDQFLHGAPPGNARTLGWLRKLKKIMEACERQPSSLLLAGNCLEVSLKTSGAQVKGEFIFLYLLIALYQKGACH